MSVATVLVVATTLSVVGGSLLARWASAVYAYTLGFSGLLPTALCGIAVGREDAVSRLPFGMWLGVVLLLALAVPWGVRSFGLSWSRAISGIFGDSFLCLLLIASVAIGEAVFAGDGGMGLSPRGEAALGSLVFAEFALPPVLRRVFPIRRGEPMRPEV